MERLRDDRDQVPSKSWLVLGADRTVRPSLCTSVLLETSTPPEPYPASRLGRCSFPMLKTERYSWLFAL
jgi:hypothetical protein